VRADLEMPAAVRLTVRLHRDFIAMMMNFDDYDVDDDYYY
jgi:hypothetical protein